jgi:hypothetical protein
LLAACRPWLALAALLAVSAAASPARAEASTWVFVGGGALGWKQSEYNAFNPAGTLVVDGGVGTSPDARFVVGALFRLQPIFPTGAIHATYPSGAVDLSLLTRFATHGFQAGDWGVAIDVGGFARPWGYQSIGFAGSVSLGMPLGITLMAQTELGTDHAISLGAVAGIDLLRLTIYRQTLLKWWQNPSPAWRKKESDPTASSLTPSHF